MYSSETTVHTYGMLEDLAKMGLDSDEQSYTISIDTQSAGESEDILARFTQSLISSE